MTLLTSLKIYFIKKGGKRKKSGLPIHFVCRNEKSTLDVFKLVLGAKYEMAKKIASAFDGEQKLPLRLCYEMGFSKEILDLVSNANPNAQEFMFGKMRDKFPTGNPMNNNLDLL